LIFYGCREYKEEGINTFFIDLMNELVPLDNFCVLKHVFDVCVNNFSKPCTFLLELSLDKLSEPVHQIVEADFHILWVGNDFLLVVID
jgi:hypothetical protein